MIEWLSPDELVKTPPAARWVIPGLQLCPGRASMIYGEKGTAKSLITYSLAISAAAGLPVWGVFPVAAPLMVALVDTEMGMGPSRRRVHACARGVGVDLSVVRDRIKLASRPRVKLSSVNDLVASFTGIDLAIIDTFAGATPNVDKNDECVRAWIDPMGEASERTGTTFLFIHHEGTKKGRSRGSSAIEDACGAVFRVAGIDPSKPRRLRQTKASVDSAELIEPMNLIVEKLDSGRGARVTVDGYANKAHEALGSIVDALRGWKSAAPTKNELYAAVKGSRPQFFEALDLGERTGAISTKREGNSIRIHLPDLADRSAAE